jgi:hypothetical protein
MILEILLPRAEFFYVDRETEEEEEENRELWISANVSNNGYKAMQPTSCSSFIAGNVNGRGLSSSTFISLTPCISSKGATEGSLHEPGPTSSTPMQFCNVMGNIHIM